MNWTKILKEISKFVAKNWYYIVPPIMTGIKNIYDRLKRKKKDNPSK